MVISISLEILMFKNSKRGSYLVEASITLPIFIISVCSLILIIRIVSLCENITFITSTNMMDAIFGHYNRVNLITLCKDIEDSSDYVSSFKVSRYKYLYEDNELSDLIILDAEAEFEVMNAVGIYGQISFDTKVLCRAFTGETQSKNPLDESEFCENDKSQMIYVFPKYGERYHNKNCRYLDQNIYKAAYWIQMDKEDALRKGYTPCIICQGAVYEQ